VRTITVSLAGREYAIQQLPIKANRAWREKFGAPAIKKMGDAFRDSMLLTKKEFPNGDGLLKAVVDLAATHFGSVTEILLGSVETVGEALCDYAPEIAADRERIEAEGFDGELVAAFLKVVQQLAYPFGQVLTLASLATKLGQVGALTSPSSPGQSGGSGKTTSTRPRKRRS
jgi:hypothetical protein